MFQATARRLIQYVGRTKLTDLPNEWQGAVQEVMTTQESIDSRIKKAEIRGSQPHRSYDDPSDEKDVISVRLLDEEDKRVASIHVHQDGSSKKVTWR